MMTHPTIPLVALLVFLPLIAEAENPKVFFFGGYIATPSQVACWAQGAMQANGAYEYQGIRWPAGVSSAGAAAAETKAASALIIPAMNEVLQNKDRKFIIVGHSSGAALSNRLAREVIRRDPSAATRLKLIALDGFIPDGGLRSKIETVCVNARSRYTRSRNYAGMQGCAEGAKSRTWTYTDSRSKPCQTAWCGHFSLVTKAAPADLGRDWPSRGYVGCESEANIDWLDK